MPLRAAESYEQYLLDPIGRYAVGDGFLAWGVTRELVGLTVWGRAGFAEAGRVLYAYDRPHPPSLAPKCDVVFDCRRVDSLDAGGFDFFIDGFRERLDRYRARVRRQAVVRPSGLVGAAATGFVDLIGAVENWRVFDGLGDALRWMDRDDATELRGEIEAIVDGAAAGSPVVARLRSWLAARGGKATLPEAARALALSARTLQRALRDADTSLRDEVDRARLEIAKALLRDGDEKIEVVARKIGCGGVASFSTFFRRMTGESPSSFRARR